MSDTLYDLFVAPLMDTAHQKAFIGGSLVAIVCGVIGCFVILRRMAFLGDALSHAMLAGVVAGYLFMNIVFGADAHAPAMIVGSMLAGVVTVGMIGFVSKVSRIKEDTAIGIMYTGIFAVGGIMVSVFSNRIHLHLYDFIVGMVLAVKDGHLWMMAIIAAAVLAIVILLFRQFQITTFDPVMAASIGIPVVAMDYLLTTCTSLVVVGAVPVVGIVLVVGMLVTPAATAYLLSDRLGRMLVLSALFGVSSVVMGLFVTIWVGNIAPGSAIVVVSTIQFLFVLTVAPRYGIVADWLRRRRMVPQEMVEDVLGSVLRAPEQVVAVSSVIGHVEGRAVQIERAIRRLEKQGLLDLDNGHLRLTEAGEREALRLRRAHRLWETYLEHVGAPAEKLHEKAHVLEHVHDEDAVDYLDDKLGHPLRDPHGAAIPEDFVHLVPGREVKAALLREGHRGTITTIGPHAAQLPLHPDMNITMGSRRDDNRWTLILDDGKEVLLNHAEADAVTVRFESDVSSN